MRPIIKYALVSGLLGVGGIGAAGPLPANAAPASVQVATPAPSAAAGYSCRDTTILQGKSAFSIEAAYHGLTATVSGKLSDSYGLTMGTNASIALVAGTEHWTIGGLPPKDAQIIVQAGVTTQGDELCVLRFGGEVHPEVLAQYYTGGAHCCFVPVIYAFQGGSYRASASLGIEPWAKAIAPSPVYDPNGGLGPELVGSSLVLRTADGRFDYEFACFACGGGPIRLLGFQPGHFVDVTSRYPAVIRADAAFWWRAVTSGLATKPPDVLGLVAPWVADECQVGQAAAAWKTVASLEARGDLNPGQGEAFTSVGAAYVKNLHAFLSKLGYCAAN